MSIIKVSQKSSKLRSGFLLLLLFLIIVIITIIIKRNHYYYHYYNNNINTYKRIDKTEFLKISARERLLKNIKYDLSKTLKNIRQHNDNCVYI